MTTEERESILDDLLDSVLKLNEETMPSYQTDSENGSVSCVKGDILYVKRKHTLEFNTII